MKKFMAFTAALLMTASLSVPFAYAEDETDAADTGSAVTTESGETSETPSEEEAEEEEKADEDEKPAVDMTKWHLSASKPAEGILTDDAENKEYVFKIVNPGGEKRGGTDKWDLQFRIKGLSIEKDHEYTIRYCISSDYAGSYYTKISNPNSETVGSATAGEVWHNQYGVSTIKSYVQGTIQRDADTDYSKAWDNQPIDKGDTLNVTCNFTGIESLPEAEWCFFLGGAGQTTSTDCFTPGTTVRFTNLVLKDNTTGETLVEAYPYVMSDVKGDIDGDGAADLTDLSLMCLAMVGDKNLDDAQLDRCDVDGDGKFRLADVAHFRQYLSKVIEEL